MHLFSSPRVFYLLFPCVFSVFSKAQAHISEFYILISMQFQPEDKPPDQYMVTLELGLVDIFTSLCRFEWQAGYQELATALFQAELEYSLFSPSLLLTEHSKKRLFEYFWNSNGARVGEEGALGWSTWLEKEEETRQKLAKEETLDENEKGGWTGWSEPSVKSKETEKNGKNAIDIDALVEETEEGNESEGAEQEDDVEALLKQLGIDVDASVSGDVKDCSTWVRWSKEESSRDREQWLPIRTNSGIAVVVFSFSCCGSVKELILVILNGLIMYLLDIFVVSSLLSSFLSCLGFLLSCLMVLPK